VVRIFIGPFLAVAVLLLSTVLAQDRNGIKQLTPTTTGSTGLFNLPTAGTLRRGEVSVGISGVHFNREPGDLDFSVFPVHVTVGLHDRVEFFLSWEVGRRVHNDGLAINKVPPGGPLIPARPANGTAPVAFFNDSPFLDASFSSGSGELQTGVKLNLLSEGDRHPFGLAIQPFVKVSPSRSRSRLLQGLTNGGNEAGYDLVFSKSFLHGGLVTLRQGFRFVSDTHEVSLQDEFTYGIGVALPVGSGKTQIIGELVGNTWIGEAPATVNPRSPLDLYLGTRFSLSPQVSLSAAYGLSFRRLALNNPTYGGQPTDRSGWLFQVAFHRKVNRPPSILCIPDQITLTEGEVAVIRASLTDPDDSALTLTWQTDQGRIQPTGTTASFDSTGMQPGRYFLKAEVADGREVASCTAEISIRESAPLVP